MPSSATPGPSWSAAPDSPPSGVDTQRGIFGLELQATASPAPELHRLGHRCVEIDGQCAGLAGSLVGTGKVAELDVRGRVEQARAHGCRRGLGRAPLVATADRQGRREQNKDRKKVLSLQDRCSLPYDCGEQPRPPLISAADGLDGEHARRTKSAGARGSGRACCVVDPRARALAVRALGDRLPHGGLAPYPFGRSAPCCGPPLRRRKLVSRLEPSARSTDRRRARGLRSVPRVVASPGPLRRTARGCFGPPAHGAGLRWRRGAPPGLALRRLHHVGLLHAGPRHDSLVRGVPARRRGPRRRRGSKPRPGGLQPDAGPGLALARPASGRAPRRGRLPRRRQRDRPDPQGRPTGLGLPAGPPPTALREEDPARTRSPAALGAPLRARADPTSRGARGDRRTAPPPRASEHPRRSPSTTRTSCARASPSVASSASKSSSSGSRPSP